MRRSLTLVSLVSLATLTASCAHSLSVVNKDDYAVRPTEGPRRVVAVRPVHADDDTAEYVDHVVEALRRHPSVSIVHTNWKPEVGRPGLVPDLVLDIRPQAEYVGSGWNFPLTFPGFLFFLPAAHGYVYHGNVTTEIDIFAGAEPTPSRTVTVPTDFEMRHCDFGRAFFAESGWWTPGYGATSLVSAPYMISYDADATAPFHEEIDRVYGDYVAEQLIRAVNGTIEDEAVTVVAVAARSR